MEQVYLEMAPAESYEYDSFSTHGDSMIYSYDSLQYSAIQSNVQPGYNYYHYQNGVDQLLNSEDIGQNAVIILESNAPSGSYESISVGTFNSETNSAVMSFKSEAELLDYFSSIDDLADIQVLPVASNMENTDKYSSETAVIVDDKDSGTVLPSPVKQPISTKKSDVIKSRKRPRIVYENSSFVCEPCDRTFGRRSSLVQHNNVHHSGPREHRCHDCGKRFHTPEDLLRHIQRHVAQHKPHKCAECPRQFNYHQDLERHVTVQHGVAKHKCQHCGKRIARRDHLLLHEASHTKKLARDRRRNLFLELMQQLKQKK